MSNPSSVFASGSIDSDPVSEPVSSPSPYNLKHKNNVTKGMCQATVVKPHPTLYCPKARSSQVPPLANSLQITIKLTYSILQPLVSFSNNYSIGTDVHVYSHSFHSGTLVILICTYLAALCATRHDRQYKVVMDLPVRSFRI